MVIGVMTATSLAYTAASTARLGLNAGLPVTMPTWARELVAVRVYHTFVTMTASQASIVRFDLESSDVHLDPFECSPTPQQGGLGTTHDVHTCTPEIFASHIPLQGGEDIYVYATSLQAQTGVIQVGASLIISSERTGRQIFRKCGTMTATGTTVATTAGTAYTINGAEEVIEVIGSVAKQGTMTASQPCHGYFEIKSGDFKVGVPLRFCPTPQGAGLGTIGTPSIGGLARYPVRVPTNSTTRIQDYFYNSTALTAAGQFLSQVGFWQLGRN